MPIFRNKEETRPIISLGRRSDPYILCSDSEEDFEEIEFEKAVFERQCLYEPSSRYSRHGTVVRKLLFCLLLVVFVAILVSVFYYYFSRQSLQRWRRIEMEEILVKIDGGYVKGILEDDVFVYKGIPFATPPLHKNRWHYPKYCTWNRCWNGTFKASSFGQQCVQAKFSSQGDVESVVGSEDCLFVNVWSPTTSYNDEKLPVLVYIHGGGLVSFSGNEAGLHPTPDLVKQLKVVGVSINYRLNAFGFLALDVFSASNPERNTSGNYGFMDQILALKWIQKNIEQFGGDPKRITLLGQGSGGTSILSLIASPLAKGLFHRAIAMSPSTDIATTASAASKDNMAFVRKTSCSNKDGEALLQCLYGLSAEEIVHAIPWNTYPYWGMNDRYDLPTKGLYDGGIAVIDGYIVPESPVVSITKGHANDVPLIIGSTAQEIGVRPNKSFWHSTLNEFENYTREKLEPFFPGKPERIEEVFKLYNFTLYEQSLQLLYTTLASDIREVCPSEYLAITASKHFKNGRVYRYIVTNSPFGHVKMPFAVEHEDVYKYSFNMWDLIAFFGYPKPFKYRPLLSENFSQLLREEFKHFTYTGEVKNVHWMNYPHNRTAIFTSHDGLQVIPKFYHGKQCLFWFLNGFANYAWVN